MLLLPLTFMKQTILVDQLFICNTCHLNILSLLIHLLSEFEKLLKDCSSLGTCVSAQVRLT